MPFQIIAILIIILVSVFNTFLNVTRVSQDRQTHLYIFLRRTS